MPLHRVSSVTIGVPDVAATAEFYRDFNLSETAPGIFATADGGEQLRLAQSPVRRLLELAIGADDDAMAATDPGTGVRVRVEVAARVDQEPAPATPYNGPGRTERAGRAPKLPAPGEEPMARPRKLGHVVIGTTDLEPSQRFFQDGIGFKLSDQISDRAFFLRCSTDHHNLLLQHAPVRFLHHTS